MRLTESQLRKTIRKLLVTELFVSPKKKKTSVLKRALDRDEPLGGYYGDPMGFGEFEEEDPAEHAHHAISAIHDLASAAGVDLESIDGGHGDEGDLSSSWDGDELEDPHVDYGQHLHQPDHGDR